METRSLAGLCKVFELVYASSADEGVFEEVQPYFGVLAVLLVLILLPLALLVLFLLLLLDFEFIII